jgi:hypothetical protein
MNNSIKDYLNKVYNCFGYENISICGSLVDFYWIDWQEINDIDLIVNTNSLTKFFNIKWPKLHIKQQNFDIQRKTSTRFITNFYQGKFFDCKIDLYIVDDIQNIKRDISLVPGIKFDLPEIWIDSLPRRIFLLQEHLNYVVTDKTEKWERDWIKFKKIKAAQKLSIYKQKYPECFN